MNTTSSIEALGSITKMYVAMYGKLMQPLATYIKTSNIMLNQCYLDNRILNDLNNKLRSIKKVQDMEALDLNKIITMLDDLDAIYTKAVSLIGSYRALIDKELPSGTRALCDTKECHMFLNKLKEYNVPKLPNEVSSWLCTIVGQKSYVTDNNMIIPSQNYKTVVFRAQSPKELIPNKPIQSISKYISRITSTNKYIIDGYRKLEPYYKTVLNLVRECDGVVGREVTLNDGTHKDIKDNQLALNNIVQFTFATATVSHILLISLIPLLQKLTEQIKEYNKANT